jgi:hypothetical protein
MNRFSDGKKSIVNHYKEEREPKAPFLSIILLSLIYLFVNKSWIYENLLSPNKSNVLKSINRSKNKCRTAARKTAIFI